jgi:hypothetical protein
MNVNDKTSLLEEIVNLKIQIGELKYVIEDLTWKLSLATTNGSYETKRTRTTSESDDDFEMSRSKTGPTRCATV